jgi:hypothetical protein
MLLPLPSTQSRGRQLYIPSLQSPTMRDSYIPGAKGYHTPIVNEDIPHLIDMRKETRVGGQTGTNEPCDSSLQSAKQQPTRYLLVSRPENVLFCVKSKGGGFLRQRLLAGIRRLLAQLKSVNTHTHTSPEEGYLVPVVHKCRYFSLDVGRHCSRQDGETWSVDNLINVEIAGDRSATTR